MWRILQKIQKKLIIAIPVLMLGGILFGYFVGSSFLKATIIPLTFLMVYPMMVNLQVEKLLGTSNSQIKYLNNRGLRNE